MKYRIVTEVLRSNEFNVNKGFSALISTGLLNQMTKAQVEGLIESLDRTLRRISNDPEVHYNYGELLEMTLDDLIVRTKFEQVERFYLMDYFGYLRDEGSNELFGSFIKSIDKYNLELGFDSKNRTVIPSMEILGNTLLDDIVNNRTGLSRYLTIEILEDIQKFLEDKRKKEVQ